MRTTAVAVFLACMHLARSDSEWVAAGRGRADAGRLVNIEDLESRQLAAVHHSRQAQSGAKCGASAGNAVCAAGLCCSDTVRGLTSTFPHSLRLTLT